MKRKKTSKKEVPLVDLDAIARDAMTGSQQARAALDNHFRALSAGPIDLNSASGIQRGIEISQTHAAGAVVRASLALAVERRSFELRFSNQNDGLHIGLSGGRNPQTIVLPESVAIPSLLYLKRRARLAVHRRHRIQKGLWETHIQGNSYEIDVTSIPQFESEAVELRLRPRMQNHVSLEQLGMTPVVADVVRDAVRGNGLTVVSGPYGSGTSTTLYALLHMLNEPESSVVSVERAPHSRIEGVSQIQFNPDTMENPAQIVSHVLQQDVDVLALDHLLDGSTALPVALAALEGVSVLASLPASDSSAVIGQLDSFGVPEDLAAIATSAIISQRLVPAVCLHCRRSRHLTEDELGKADTDRIMATLQDWGELLPNQEFSEVVWYESDGCEHCGNSGLNGSTALFEVSLGERQAPEAKPQTLSEDLILKAKHGKIPVDVLVSLLPTLS